MNRLDLSDILVRMMANQNHVPLEEWEGRNVRVSCEMCEQSWPCATRVELGINGEVIGSFQWDNHSYQVIPADEDGLFAIVDGEAYELQRLDDGEEAEE